MFGGHLGLRRETDGGESYAALHGGAAPPAAPRSSSGKDDAQVKHPIRSTVSPPATSAANNRDSDSLTHSRPGPCGGTPSRSSLVNDRTHPYHVHRRDTALPRHAAVTPRPAPSSSGGSRQARDQTAARASSPLDATHALHRGRRTWQAGTLALRRSSNAIRRASSVGRFGRARWQGSSSNTVDGSSQLQSGRITGSGGTRPALHSTSRRQRQRHPRRHGRLTKSTAGTPARRRQHVTGNARFLTGVCSRRLDRRRARRTRGSVRRRATRAGTGRSTLAVSLRLRRHSRPRADSARHAALTSSSPTPGARPKKSTEKRGRRLRLFDQLVARSATEITGVKSTPG